jgi:hypothetical protein
MSFQFSQKLIEETILCFKEEDGLDISEETANEYLMSLSNLYLAYSKLGGPRPPKAGPPASVELDSNHTQGEIICQQNQEPPSSKSYSVDE